MESHDNRKKSIEWQKTLKLHQKVESNCQFLTIMRKNISKSTEQRKNRQKMVEQYIKNCQYYLQYQNYVYLLTQLCYLLYSCKVNRVQLCFSEHDIRVDQGQNQEEKKFNIVIYYKLKLLTEEKQNYYVQIFTKTYEYFFQILQFYFDLGLTFGPIDKKAQNALELFHHQFLLIRNAFKDQNTFFRSLQQTNLFSQCSELYRIKSSSILDIIKTGGFQNFYKYIKKDIQLTFDLNQRKNREEIQLLRSKEEQIIINIINFFKEIGQVRQQLKTLNKTIFNFKTRQNFRQSFYQYLEKLNCMKEGNNLNTPKKKLPVMNFIIEYSHAQRNFIMVSLIVPSLTINIQSSDYLAFQSNLLSFDSTNVSIQFIQDINLGMKLVFKAITSFHFKQPCLQKIIQLIDLLIISHFIYEPELNQQKVMKNARSHLRFVKLSQRANHYSKMFMKCAKKAYRIDEQ